MADASTATDSTPTTHVLFDLDGTLVDSRRGIAHSLRLALEQLEVPVEADHDFTWCIGGSLWNIMAHYGNTSDQHWIDHAVAVYRHIYRDGPMFEYDVYDGVTEMLQQLAGSGKRVLVATAKAHEYAREVIAAAPFAPYIHHVYGSELDGTNVDKADLIRHILRTEQIDAENAVMVGDRDHDVYGALANGVRSIAVTYGYGTTDELKNAHTTVHHAREILQAAAGTP